MKPRTKVVRAWAVVWKDSDELLIATTPYSYDKTVYLNEVYPYEDYAIKACTSAQCEVIEVEIRPISKKGSK